MLIYDSGNKCGKLTKIQNQFFFDCGTVLAFALITNMVREVKKQPSNFKQIRGRCFTLLNIFI